MIAAPPARIVNKEEEIAKFGKRKALKMNIKGLIGESHAVAQPVHSHFICSICFDVANDPTKCQNCEHIYC